MKERETLIEKLYELNTGTYEDSKRAIEMMYNICNNKLFKYRSGTLYDIINLSNNQLPFCTASILNDPFECRFTFDVINDLNFENEQAMKELEEGIDKMARSWQICSLSETNNEILMWSHYSNDHKGFCLEYNYDELQASCKNFFSPIRYIDNLPEITQNIENSYLILLSKAKQWNYELEWRIVGKSNSNDKYPLIDVPNPKAIYLGCRIEEGLKSYLINFCKTKNIDIYQGKKSLKHYRLEFEKIG